MADYRKTGAKYEDFLDANGKFDNDKWQTADLSASDYERIMGERGFTRAKKGESGNGSQFIDRKRPVVRVEALLKNAPVAKDVRSLGGPGGAQPVSEDAQAAALAAMMGKKSSTLNSSGIDVGDLQPKNVPPRPTPNDLEGTIRNPDGSIEPPEKPSAPIDRGPPTELNDRGQDITVDAVPQRPWTPERLGLSLEETQQNKRIDPEFDTPDPRDSPWEKFKGDLKGTFSELMSPKMPAGAIDGVDPKLELARKQAAEAVQSMEGQTRANEALARESAQPDRATPRAAVQQFRKSRGLETGAAPSPAPERPKFERDLVAEANAPAPGQPGPRQPLAAAQQLMTGSAPDTSADEAEMAAANKRRDEELFLAQIASQFGHYADVQGGTETGDRGAAVRDAAGNPIKDLLAKRGLRKDALEQQQANEDRDLQRQGIMEERGAKQQSRAEAAAYQDGTSPISVRRRAQAAAFYPDIVKRIDPKVWGSMSAADVDTFLKEAAPSKIVNGKGGGLGVKTSELNTIRKGMPQGLVDTYDQLQNAYGEIDKLGGWDKVKAGGLGSMTPTMFMDPEQQAIRQTLSRVAGSFLSSGAGKSITNAEDKLLIGNIAGRPTDFAITPQMLQRGVGIIERAMANAARQSSAGVPQGAKDALFGDMGIDQKWVQGGELPKKPGTTAPVKRRIVRNGAGQRRYLNPDGSLGEEVR